MTTTSSTTVCKTHACLDVVTNIPDLVAANFQFTIEHDKRDEIPFSITIRGEVYNRTNGDIASNSATIALSLEEFGQLLNMLTEFAQNNGFSPVVVPSPAP